MNSEHALIVYRQMDSIRRDGLCPAVGWAGGSR